MAKGMTVAVFEEENGYSLVAVGTLLGYVPSKKLTSIKSSYYENIIIAERGAVIYDTPFKGGKQIGKMDKNAITGSVAFTMGHYVIRAEKGFGFVRNSDIHYYNARAKPSGYLLYLSDETIYMGTSSKDAKIGSIKKGQLVDMLFYEKTGTVVRSGRTIGVASIEDAVYYDGSSKPIGAAVTTAKTTVYAGTGTKFSKLETLDSDELVLILGIHGSYSMVYTESGTFGLVANKTLDMYA